MIHQLFNSRGSHYNGTLYKGGSWDYHFHNSFELIYIIGGKMKTTVNDTDISLAADDFLLISPCMAHAITAEGDCEFCIVIFTPDYVPEYANMGALSGFSRFRLDDITLAYCRQFLIRQDEVPRCRRISCLYAICACAAEAYDETIAASIDVSFIFAVNRYLSENLTWNFRRRDIAAALGYEEHYFSSLFRQNFGISFKKHLNICRFACAQNLLRSTDHSITQIALESGFPSVRSFNCVFRELSDKSPGEYRKKHPENNA